MYYYYISFRPEPIIQVCYWLPASREENLAMFPRATPPKKHDGNMMPEASILQRPEAFDALVDVQLGELVTLGLGHHTHNVSSQLFRRQHCFVLMGTSYSCAMSKAKVAAIETSNLGILKGQSTMIATDVDYVVSVRSVVRVHLKEIRAVPHSGRLASLWRPRRPMV